MKKFLKMMLVMSLVALALSGCNVFGNEEDETTEVCGTWILSTYEDDSRESYTSTLKFENNKSFTGSSKFTYEKSNEYCSAIISASGTYSLNKDKIPKRANFLGTSKIEYYENDSLTRTTQETFNDTAIYKLENSQLYLVDSDEYALSGWDEADIYIKQ